MINLELNFHLNPAKRALKTLQPADHPLSNFTYEIKNFTFFCRYTQVPQSLQLNLERRLLSSPALYSFIRTDARKLIIQPNQTEYIQDNLFMNIQLPIESFLLFRKLDDAQGSLQSSIFAFDHFHLSQAILTCNDQQFPSEKYDYLFQAVEDGDVAFSCFDAYSALFSQDDVYANQASFIDLQRFTDKKFFILRLDLANPSINSASACSTSMQAARIGNCNLSLKWSVNNNPALEVVCLMKYYSNITINNQREITKDYNL